MTRSSSTDRPPHVLIRASAGSGKTYQLSNRFLDLVQRDAPVDSILGATFTRAAAAEIQNRVLERLAEAVEHESKRRELGQAIGVPDLSRDRCLELLVLLTRQLHRLRISTLDSFFIQIAQTFSWELGLPAHWRIIDDLEDARIREDAIAAVLAESEQSHLARLVQLLTKGEASRSVGDLLRTTVGSLYAIFLQSSREAWQRVPQRTCLRDGELESIVDQLEAAPLPTTDARWAKARATDVALARTGAWETFPAKGLAAKVADESLTYYKKPIPESLAALYRKLLDHAGAVILNKIAAQTVATYDLLEQFHLQYERLKHERSALRFEDVTRHVSRWLQARREQAADESATLEQLAFRLDARIDHLLLDEFQDTSADQWNVIRPLAERVVFADNSSFFCVGDVKQAIYGWRGGVAEIFDAIQEQLPPVTSSHLAKSFRSAQPVIDSVNRVFQQLSPQEGWGRAAAAIERWTKNFPEHTTQHTRRAGYVAVEVAPEVELPPESWDEDVEDAGGESSDDDATRSADPMITFAADRIAALKAQAPSATIGVLVRGNKRIAPLIYELRKRNVAASEEGGNPLSDSAAVQLVLSALDFADHPGNTVARFHVAHSPLAAGLGWPRSAAAGEYGRLAGEIRRQLSYQGYGATIAAWSRSMADACDAREWRRLRQLVTRAYEYDANATLRPSDFVRVVEAEAVADPSSADVRVTTIHKSKGLQYDIVVLPELDAPVLGQTPSYVARRPDPTGAFDLVCRYVSSGLRDLLPPQLQALFPAHDLRVANESLCVFYVALTRAIRALHLLVAPTRSAKGNVPLTYAGLLRAALVDGERFEPGEIPYRHGQENWYAADQRATPTGTAPSHEPATRSPEQPSSAAPLDIPLAPLVGPRRRGLERVSPSALEGGGLRKLSTPGPSTSGPGDRVAGRQRGIVMHAWFEQIQWLDDGVPDPEALRRRAIEVMDAQFDAKQLDAWLDDFRQACQSPAIAELLSRRAYDRLYALGFPASVATSVRPAERACEVFTERKFAIRQGDQLVNGVVDRLIVIQTGGRRVAADIVDYKTDVVEPGDASALREKVEYYRPQLAAYRRAVAAFLSLPVEHVASRLVFTHPRQVVPVT